MFFCEYICPKYRQQVELAIEKTTKTGAIYQNWTKTGAFVARDIDLRCKSHGANLPGQWSAIQFFYVAVFLCLRCILFRNTNLYEGNLFIFGISRFA